MIRALYYLVKYGYVQPKNSSSALLTEEGLGTYLTSAIMDFQVNYRMLTPTYSCQLRSIVANYDL